jgi:hypothetical protein
MAKDTRMIQYTETFNERILSWLENTKDQIRKEVEQCVLTMEDELTTRTPVDTSRALSNWQVKVSYQNKRYLPANYLGKGGSTAERSAAKCMSRTRTELKRNFKLGKKVFIFNNCPYIVRLNEGYSFQAPAGFVEAALAKGQEVFE